ncbi:MAG: hypothetical protein KDB27_19990 [Planctomycetales bacterium]|nr:hypothetical protein [Planctomycetales bacterium]
MHYLQPDRIVETIAILQTRIGERFPNSGLSKVCGHLLEIAKVAEQKTIWFGQPVRWLRVLCWAFSLLIVAVSIGTIIVIDEAAQGGPMRIGLAEFIQILEAGINDIVLIGAAMFFLISLETRYKRGRALTSIHELRSIAHIIDMHQLTKDPERIMNKKFSSTGSSPKHTMTRFELRRYLDYCSEMLSLTGKIAALYIQDFNDSVAIASVNEVEELCTGLSRKIWQKVSILQDHEDD